jgi:D-alanyl-D-alanine carboxypeptidase
MTMVPRAANALTLMLLAWVVLMLSAADGLANPAASIVIDARNGETIAARNADQRLHPASLTKMMTLYLAFEAIEAGRLRLDQRVVVSAHASRQPPSKMGLRAGQRVLVQDLIRAAAVRSANDAAVALAEAIGGSEARFAQMMTTRARQLGMTGSSFRNASGLTASGHLSTARDMAHLGRRLLYDFPEYYNVFGRRTTEAMGRRINTTNRLLGSYMGADGIKTGYTRAAGFNLVASAERGSKRVIAVVFGGRTSGARDAEVARLMDLGLAGMPVRVAEVPPSAAPAAAAETRTAATARGDRRLIAPMPTPRDAEPTTVDAMVASLQGVTGALAPSAAHAAVPAEAEEIGEGAEAEAVTTMVLAMLPPANPRRSASAAAAPRQVATWSVDLGRFEAREEAVARLATVAFGHLPGLAEAGREVSQPDASNAFRARLTGLDGMAALTACAVLNAHGSDCTPVPPPMH